MYNFISADVVFLKVLSAVVLKKIRSEDFYNNSICTVR